MAFVPAVSQRKQDHRLSRFATGLDVRIGASSSPRAPQVRRGGRPRSPKSDLELEPTLVGGEPPHWSESALRACSLASLIVRFRPASGPHRPGAARLRRPPPPWLPLAPGRSDTSWMADSSLRCRGCGVATREPRGRAAAWSSSRAARTTEWLRRWGVLRR